MDTNYLAVSDGIGSGEFTSTSGSSGFIDSTFGSAVGSAAGGGTGSNAGTVGIVFGGTGVLSFDGTTTSSGGGGFGAGLSPVAFNTVTTQVPGAAFAIKKSSKKGGSSSGFAPSTFTTVVTPFSTGPTGGFGTGSGALDIKSTTTGTLLGETAMMVTIGTGSSGGEATNFGGGMGSATNYFGSVGGLGSGAGTSAAAASGTTKFDDTNGIFTGTGFATGNFNNQGAGIIGTNGVLASSIGHKNRLLSILNCLSIRADVTRTHRQHAFSTLSLHDMFATGDLATARISNSERQRENCLRRRPE
jgi:hypothetical protein